MGSETFLEVILAILLPPVGVFLRYGCGVEFWIDLLLTVLGYIPGIIYAGLNQSTPPIPLHTSQPPPPILLPPPHRPPSRSSTVSLKHPRREMHLAQIFTCDSSMGYSSRLSWLFEAVVLVSTLCAFFPFCCCHF
ncbi:low temperature and salt responsive protein family [Striga asiatica]|uniref:Low temperature and salt responsive protein family n=1 Tax=Striga asiatica TaxID=4170 RepID=A0A5A7QC38_STRAF|nr:low temperature and salt responsive protein family [Striga asiatica]